MDVPAPADRGPLTLTVGGIPRRGAAWIAAITAVTLVAGLTAWLANVEPLRVDTTVVGLGPSTVAHRSTDAWAPTGQRFTQYEVVVPAGGSFFYDFWIHNDSPFPVTVTRVGWQDEPWTATAWLGPTEEGDPRFRPPYTIPAHDHATVRVQLEGVPCIEPATSLGFGTVPVSFRLLGLVPRETRIVLPMTIILVGPRGQVCR